MTAYTTRNYVGLLNIQLFAEPNTQVTTMASEGNDLSPGMRTYYQDRLLDNAEPYLVYDQFGEKRPIPANNGKVTEFRGWEPLPKHLTTLTEGVTPDGTSLDQRTITAEVNQYGNYVTISDMLDLTHVDPVAESATELLGAQAGRSMDTVTREVVTAGTNVMYAPKSDGTEVLSRSAVTADCVLDVKTVFRAAARLRAMNTRPYDGKAFVAIIHPNVACDLMTSEDWVEAHKYATPENIYEGEIGMMGGVRFVQTTEAKIIGKDEAGAATAVYCTMVIGKGAYGTIDITGGGLKHIFKPLGSAGTADPLDQRATMGWKATKTAVRLSEMAMIRIEHACATDPEAASN